MSPTVTGFDLISIIINAIALGIGLLGIVILVLQPRACSLPNYTKALVGLIAILAIDVASSIFDLSPLARIVPQISALGYAFWPWMPVCLWGYVNGLTRAETVSPMAGNWHFSVAAIATLCLLPFLLLPGSDKIAIADGTLKAATIHHLVVALGLILFMMLWIGHMLAVAVLITRQLTAHRRRMRDLVSETSAVDLRWLDGFMLFLAIAIATTIADNLLSTAIGFELLGTIGAAVTEALIIVGLLLFGMSQQRAIPQWANEPDAEEQEEPAPQESGLRYARSSLSAEDCVAIIARLDAMMTKDELWRDPFLNLKILSERITTKPYYVTQALNTVLARNFYDYVNGWRARAAAHLLRTTDAPVLSICEDVGFNSKSTFNSVFRKEMQATPSTYRLENRASKPN